MPNITLPHTFHDNAGETASGVQVNENFTVLREAVEAIETGSAYSSKARVLGTVYQPSVTKATKVIAVVRLEANNGTAAAHVISDAAASPTTEIDKTINNNNGGTLSIVEVALNFEVPAGFYYKITNTGSTGGGAGVTSLVAVLEK